MANSYSITSSSSYQGRTMKLECYQNQNIPENKSTISWTLTSSGGSNSRIYTGPTTVVINGETVYYSDRQTSSFPATTGSVSGNIDIWHNSDGSKSISVSLSTAVYTTSVSTNSGTWTLDNIPRYSNITSAPNFNDEENPTINFTNPSNGYYPLKAKMEVGSDTNFITRNIVSTATGYTFELTDDERNKLRNSCKNSKTLNVRFTICCMSGNTELSASYLDKTMTIVNANPTFNPTIIDVNSITTALTGDSSKLVKYFSNAKYTFNAAALKGATISSYSVTNGGTSANSSSGTLNAVENNTFTFIVTDSRGYTTTKTLTPTMVDYVKLTNISTVNIDVSGTAKIRVNGNYFNGSFGNTANTLQLQYRYEVYGSDNYSSWINISNTKSNNTYNGSAEQTGLDYRQTYRFQIRVADKLDNQSSYWNVKALPVFDWSKDDFNINVDFKINGNSFLDLVYPVGSIYMSTNATSPEILFGGRWEQIKGRFLIGTGQPEDNTTDFWGNDLSWDSNGNRFNMPVGEKGGCSLFKLEVKHLPQHEHSFIDESGRYHNPTVDREHETDWGASFTASSDYKVANAVSQRMSGDESDKAHTNMPPYLSVYMWKRLEDSASYSVDNFGTGYNFTMNSNGYYESLNKSVDNSWAMCKININAPKQTTATISYINYAESNYDFGIFSNLDAELTDSNTADTTGVKKSCKGESVNEVKTLTYTVPAGNHYITVKYRKDSSSSTGNDSLQFKVSLS